jgi:hypothetical protein
MFLLVIIAIIGLIVLVVRVQAAARQKRLQYLLAKYGNQEIVHRIMNKTIWVGQTCEQLIDSLGRPADTDQKVLKTKSKEIWKYAHRGGNRYGLRITVEDGAVVGWDEKL